MEIIKPGTFSENVPCDRMRSTYDARNEQLIYKNKNIDILFFGDSITEMWDVELYFGEYGFIVNRGIAGDFTKYLLLRSEADVFQLKPKALVFLGGINDIISASPDLWYRKAGKDKSEVLNTAISNVSEIMKLCKEKGVKGYFCSVLPTDLCVPYNSFGFEGDVVKLNIGIREACQKYGAIYVDYYSRLCSDDSLHIKDGYTYDGVHPNPKCYDLMAKILKEYLK